MPLTDIVVNCVGRRGEVIVVVGVDDRATRILCDSVTVLS
jgi:hypothetical protein